MERKRAHREDELEALMCDAMAGGGGAAPEAHLAQRVTAAAAALVAQAGEAFGAARRTVRPVHHCEQSRAEERTCNLAHTVLKMRNEYHS